MELVDGQPLSALLRPDAPLDPLAVRELLAQAADGLGAAHAAGIVHRDVKPANLIVTPDRQVKITDFGIARAAEGVGLTSTGEVMGTPQYLSPEQAAGPDRHRRPPTSTPSASSPSSAWPAAGRSSARPPVATALAHLRDPIPDLPGVGARPTWPPSYAARWRRTPRSGSPTAPRSPPRCATRRPPRPAVVGAVRRRRRPPPR